MEPAVADRGRKFLEWDRLTETSAELAIRLGVLALLLYWSLVLVRPFLSIMIWAVVLAASLYPIFDWIAVRLGGRRKLAAVVVTVLSLLVVIGPAIWLTLGVIDGVGLLLDRMSADTLSVPRPWESIKSWPLIGEPVFQFWELAASNLKAAVAKLAPHLRPLGSVLLAIAASAGIGTLKFLAAVIVAGFLLAPGPALVQGLKSVVERVAPEHAQQFVDLSGATIRTVAQGVIGISALQAVLAGIGMVAADVPGSSLLTTAVLILGIIQIGPTVVILPLIVWGWMTMDTVPALAFTVYMGGVSVLDNLLKPIVMRRGIKTPIIVIMIGLIGGTLSYGITGLFLGPIILAVIWELAVAWLHSQEAEQKAERPVTTAAEPTAD